jgi:hypothetical protein
MQLAALSLYTYGNLMATLSVKSFYEGMIVLGGRKFQVGVIAQDQRDHLLIRPWQEKDDKFHSSEAQSQTVPLTPGLWLDGQAYKLSLSQSLENGELSRTLTFGSTTVETGELQLRGKFIQRLKLSSDDMSVIANSPEATLRVPRGQYSNLDVLLEAGGVRATLKSAYGPGARNALSIAEREPGVLEFGGPLTNSVTISRAGETLQLSYSLLGGGGLSYQLIDHPLQPEFKGFSEGKQIGGGQFEFG